MRRQRYWLIEVKTDKGWEAVTLGISKYGYALVYLAKKRAEIFVKEGPSGKYRAKELVHRVT